MHVIVIDSNRISYRKMGYGNFAKHVVTAVVCNEDSVQIASHKIIFVFMQKFSMFLNSIKLHLVLSVTTRHRAF